MKRVSLKVAKVLKEAGYPQATTDVYNELGEIICTFPSEETYSAAFYLEVWLWLWREKGIFIIFDDHTAFISSIDGLNIELPKLYSDPEEAIIAAIEYLVDNDLIK